GSFAAPSPVRQARPYPRRGSTMTRAPCAAAISRVRSVEPASTTSTSLTRERGISSRTRAMELASLNVGMTTLTRTPIDLSQAPARILAHHQRVHAPGASGARIGDGEGDDDVHRQLPGPGGAELRHPEGEEPQPGEDADHPRGRAGDQENAQPELGHRLQRREDACM